MHLIYGYADVPDAYQGAVIAIGNFDGLHLGHRAVIDAARQQADALGAPLAVLTFDPTPRAFFSADTAPACIASPTQRQKRLAALGVNALIQLAFDARLASTSPEAFAERILAGALRVRHVATGENFRFGHRRTGDVTNLADFGRINGFGTTAVPSLSAEGRIYSSTAIREALRRGDIREAERLLGAPWSIHGQVEDDADISIDFGAYVRPASGSYLVRITDDYQPSRLATAEIGLGSSAQSRDRLRLAVPDSAELCPGDLLQVEFLRRLPAVNFDQRQSSETRGTRERSEVAQPV